MVFCNLGITRKNRKQLMVFSFLRIFLVIRLGSRNNITLNNCNCLEPTLLH